MSQILESLIERNMLKVTQKIYKYFLVLLF
jgi:hypothetical protein